MKLLALESSAEVASVCLLIDSVFLTREGGTPGTHARFLLQWIDGLMEESGLRVSDLDAIVFSAGPGSFTGLRLSVSVAQGMAVAADRPLVAIPTLEALAHGCGDGRHLCCMDARMGEVYSAAIEVSGDRTHTVRPSAVTAPGAVLPPPGEPSSWYGCGSGYALPDLREQPWVGSLAGIDVSAAPHARSVAALARPRVAAGEFIDPALAAPLYVRDKVARTTQERLAAGGRA
ncbi:tRNA (adenosine(37)-N6)-threonylcarbamoyltransferase complex dimerization subunit type 1 TsaB [Methyloversatilis thermotolerans]|uniref:tRNA (adenosine(37)-N6)-threonylcarbamoyltransferase complex dimerization subunit type 1 TsaB n=1 Tax=Methyloversatilis thermotolerans TaxID=1346290 RepID=UPI00036FAA70|nr:tRNA (adenosine(37)-N6)-threonylcarbamoyltransferase complex dimerization subunit type 1 TsaB [Methyloversatilis thermotolerans]